VLGADCSYSISDSGTKLPSLKGASGQKSGENIFAKRKEGRRERFDWTGANSCLLDERKEGKKSWDTKLGERGEKKFL